MCNTMMKSSTIVNELCKVMIDQKKTVAIGGLTSAGNLTVLEHLLRHSSTMTLILDDEASAMSEAIYLASCDQSERIVVAETRSSEASALLSLDEDVSFITTLHAQSAFDIPMDMASMAQQNISEPIASYIQKAYSAIDFGVFVVREESNGENGPMISYIKEIVAFGEDGSSVVIVRQHIVNGEVELDLSTDIDTEMATSLFDE